MKIENVRKREGRTEVFSQEKIVRSILNASSVVGGHDQKLAKRLAEEVVGTLEKNYNDLPPSTGDIGNMVEKVLTERGHFRAKKAYVLYRKHREEIRGLESASLKSEDAVDDYLNNLSRQYDPSRIRLPGRRNEDGVKSPG